MKKMLLLICVLLAIFIGMYTHVIKASKDNITISEVEKIQEFISKIYLWQEISGEALPKFKDINKAPDIWIWEVVKKNLEQYELTYQQIQDKATEIFGKKFTKKFPQEGSQYIYYDKNSGKYITTGIGLDPLEDMFFIKNINKTNVGYEVEIVEYLEDYSDEILNSNEYMEREEIQYDIYINNLDLETIFTIKNTDSESIKIEKLKENINKFSTKTISIMENERKNVYRKCKMRQVGQS